MPVQASGKIECVEVYRRTKVQVGRIREATPAMVASVNGRLRGRARFGGIKIMLCDCSTERLKMSWKHVLSISRDVKHSR
jgi:hypothetical protein